MAILIDQTTRVICQGFTGRQASFYSERAIAGRTQMVGGVRPGKGGTQHLGLPVFDTVADAVSETNADTSVIFVPPAAAANAMLEAIEANMRLVVCITERIPVLDMARVRDAMVGSNTLLVGPNCPGIVTAGKCRIGIMPHDIFQPGRIGIVSRASTLTYEAVQQTTTVGLGQSTCVGIGADPIHGLGFVDVLKRFLDDEQTDGVIMLGEIGGIEEEQAADYLRARQSDKPVVAYIAGRHAPEGRRMGHAGAIIERGLGTAASKIDALTAAGVIVSESPSTIGSTMLGALN